jgi:hypothetical protein
LPLFDPPQTWEQLPDTIRQQALDVLTTFCLETVSSSSPPEPPDHEPSGH